MYANTYYESNKDSVLTHIVIHINKKKHKKSTLSQVEGWETLLHQKRTSNVTKPPKV